MVHAKPEFFAARGTLSPARRRDPPGRARRAAGPAGAAEEAARRPRGCSTRARKRRPPFLPGRIGLITGRASAAERDVLTNARRRWPAVEFRVVNVAVQGPTAVPQIIDALAVLDARPSRRRDHHGPRRRQRGGPAALLRRGAVPGGVRLPHAGHLRDRARDRHAAGRLRRRRARVDPDRRGQAGGARPGRGAVA